ncbi:MAG: phage virion morphogenesis protein [Paracoccaceae bacterium]
MAGAGITLTNADAAAAALAALSAALTDGTPVYDKIGNRMVARTKLRFDAGAGPDGNPWPPSLRALFDGGRTLVDRGNLVGSISHEAGPQSASWGTSVVWAAVHQFGATIAAKDAGALHFTIPGIGHVQRKSVTIPARPFIGLDDEDEDEINTIIADELASHFEGLGRAD